jgi:hypothetical protein
MSNTRPTYETQANIDAELSVMDVFAAAWQCQFHKTPRFYGFDYTITRDDHVRAFVEIKVRKKHYPTLLLSLHKWQAGMALSRDTGLPFILIASTPQGLFWSEVKPGPMQIVVGGRNDRGDSQDKEPCVLLPYANMKRLTVSG